MFSLLYAGRFIFYQKKNSNGLYAYWYMLAGSRKAYQLL
jgi:hypothetical protein